MHYGCTHLHRLPPLYRAGCRGASTDTAAEFEALTYTEISQIQDLGDFGDVAEDLTFALVRTMTGSITARVRWMPGFYRWC